MMNVNHHRHSIGLFVLVGLVIFVAIEGAASKSKLSSPSKEDFDIVAAIQTLWNAFISGDLLSQKGLERHNEVLQRLLSKALSSLIIVGACIIKVPQILAIVSSGSVVGLSLFSLYAELISGVGTVLYNIHINSPFVAYGEVVFILIQNIVLVGLIWSMSIPPVSLGGRILPIIVIGAFGAVSYYLPEHKDYLIALNVPLILAMRLPQIWDNFSNGHTGTLAVATVFMGLGGSLARVFTTYKELGPEDPQLMVHALATSLNLVVFAQIVIYYKTTQKVLAAEQLKKTK